MFIKVLFLENDPVFLGTHPPTEERIQRWFLLGNLRLYKFADVYPHILYPHIPRVFE